MKKSLFVWAAALMTLVACNNNDELLNNENPGGKVTVTATLPGGAPDSRVALTEDNTDATAPAIKVAWETEESFSVIRGSENKTYSKNVEGSTFTGNAHTVTDGTYYAFYPTTDAIASNAIPYDLSQQTGTLDEAKTYMYAKNGTDGKNYEFNHLTALVKFTLTLPDDASGVTPSKVVISSDKLLAKSTVDLTGENVVYSTADNTATSIKVTTTSLTFYAYVNPMTASGEDKNKFVISMDGNDGNYYSGTLETSVSINANYLYAATVSMIKVEKGDYAMADGSFIKYDAGVTLTTEQKANVRGIVFWTTAETTTEGRTTPASLTDDEVMAEDFPGCNHGLIVALKDLSYSYVWQGQYHSSGDLYTESVYDNFQKTHDTYKEYEPIVSSASTPEYIVFMNKILGYNNTKVLEAYNSHCKVNDKNNYVVTPIEKLADWKVTYPAPVNTTGWFLPSVKELHMLCYKDVDDVWNTYGNSCIETKAVVNASLEKVGGNQLTASYWSSTESEENYAFLVHFDNAMVQGYYKTYAQYVRAVCAY